MAYPTHRLPSSARHRPVVYDFRGSHDAISPLLNRLIEEDSQTEVRKRMIAKYLQCPPEPRGILLEGEITQQGKVALSLKLMQQVRYIMQYQ